jgi:hypothetical protein
MRIAGGPYRGIVAFRSKSTGQVSAKANDIGRCGRGCGHISAMIRGRKKLTSRFETPPLSMLEMRVYNDMA